MTNITKSIGFIFTISLILVAGAPRTTNAQGQTPVTSKDVNVTNTPTVILAPGSTVGIDPAKNTVKLDPAAPVIVRAEGTVLAYDQVLTANGPYTTTATVNVSAYSKIRVVATRLSGSNESYYIHLLMQMDEVFDPFARKVFLGTNLASGGSSGTQVYDLPGNWVIVHIEFDTYAINTYRIQIYGRR